MKYKLYSYNNSEIILNNDKTLFETYNKLLSILSNITDDEIIDKFDKIGKNSKSISNTITQLIEEKLIESGWNKEQPIFKDFFSFQSGKRWTLDFYKSEIQLEIAFNHEESTAWNLMKFQLASQPNSFYHNQEVRIGIIILATNQFKKSGGFDGSVGSYEKYIDYLTVFKPFISIPILLIGLQSLEDYKIKHRNIKSKKIGQVREIL